MVTKSKTSKTTPKKRRVKVKELQGAQEKLNTREMKKVKGGATSSVDGGVHFKQDIKG